MTKRTKFLEHKNGVYCITCARLLGAGYRLEDLRATAYRHMEDDENYKHKVVIGELNDTEVMVSSAFDQHYEDSSACEILTTNQ